MVYNLNGVYIGTAEIRSTKPIKKENPMRWAVLQVVEEGTIYEKEVTIGNGRIKRKYLDERVENECKRIKKRGAEIIKIEYFEKD